MPMNKKERMRQRVVSDNEQDLATINEWWDFAMPEEKQKILDRIARMPDSGVDNVIARLAELKFGELIESRGW